MLVLASLPSVKWSHRCSTRASPLLPPGRPSSQPLPAVCAAGRSQTGGGEGRPAPGHCPGPRAPPQEHRCPLSHEQAGGWFGHRKAGICSHKFQKHTRIGMTYAGASTSDKWTQGDRRQASPAHSGKLVYDVPAEPRPASPTPRPTQNLFLPMEPSEQRALSYHLDRGVILHF